MAVPPEPRIVNTLGEHRRRLGLTQAQLAERLVALGEEGTEGRVVLDANAVSRHETGRLLPLSRHRALYVQFYGVGERELWPDAAPAPLEDPVITGPWDHAGTVGATAALTGSGDRVQRRTFLLVAGSALTTVAHQWLVQEPGRLAAAVHGDRITPELAGRLPGMIGELRRMEDAHDSKVVLALVERELGWVAGMLNHGSYTDSTAGLLHQSLAEMAQIAGYLAYDLGDHVRAQRSYLTGLRAAHTAGDQILGAHILKCLAEQAAETGRPADAHLLIDSALAGTRTAAAPGQQSLLWAWKARAHAATGDRRACLDAIDTARTLAGRRTAGEDPAWLYWLSTADITVKAGEALLTAGLASRAETLLQDGLAEMPADRHIGDRQVFLARLASAQASNGRLDAGVESGHQALDLAEHRPSGRATIALGELCTQLRHHDSAHGVKDLLDRARTAGARTGERLGHPD